MSFDFALIENDLQVLANGQIRTIADTPKLRQDILKVIITPLGSNRFHPWYGCTVSEDIIGKNLPENIMNMDIETSIRQSLERLKTLQLGQQATQKVTLAELINIVGGVTAYRAPFDLRQVKIEVVVYTRNLTKIEEIFTISLV